MQTKNVNIITCLQYILVVLLKDIEINKTIRPREKIKERKERGSPFLVFKFPPLPHQKKWMNLAMTC